jgi:hypothetical protein
MEGLNEKQNKRPWSKMAQQESKDIKTVTFWAQKNKREVNLAGQHIKHLAWT